MVVTSAPVDQPRSERPPERFRWIVAAIETVVGCGAVFGGYGLLTDAAGLGAKKAWLEGSVFADYTVPGLFLLVVIGGGMLVAAGVTVVARRAAPLVAGAMALVLVSWGVVETVTIGWRGVGQLVLVSVFVAGPAVALAAFAVRGIRSRDTA
jgi:hypothetical protein